MMFHTYSVNDLHHIDERTKVLYRLAGVAGISVGIVGAVITWASDLSKVFIGTPVAVSAPTAVIVYMLLVRQVEYHWWKVPVMRLLLGISLPDIHGQYEGQVTTRYRNGANIDGLYQGDMSVSQTWSTLLIRFKTLNTISHSTGASMSLEGNYVALTLEYQVVLLYQEKENNDIQGHTGTSTMRFKMLRGECDFSDVAATYYTDHRETGRIQLKRVADE